VTLIGSRKETICNMLRGCSEPNLAQFKKKHFTTILEKFEIRIPSSWKRAELMKKVLETISEYNQTTNLNQSAKLAYNPIPKHPNLSSSASMQNSKTIQQIPQTFAPPAELSPFAPFYMISPHIIPIDTSILPQPQNWMNVDETINDLLNDKFFGSQMGKTASELLFESSLDKNMPSWEFEAVVDQLSKEYL
jgi:hypothetical protein